MAKKRVFRYRVYDVTKDDYVISTRMATREKIHLIQAEVLPDTETKIDSSLLEDGWTKKDFDPNTDA
jgi:hypothetical protein